jgi:hypothetical protein
MSMNDVPNTFIARDTGGYAALYISRLEIPALARIARHGTGNKATITIGDIFCGQVSSGTKIRIQN